MTNKIMRWVLFIGLLCTVIVTMTAQTAADLYQQALIQEQAVGDIDQAIKLFEQSAKVAGSDSSLAAKALLGAGRSYEQLGSPRACAAYQQIVRTYSSEREQVAIARERLAALSMNCVSGQETMPAALNDAQFRQLISDLSESIDPTHYRGPDNYISNELAYPTVFPALSLGVKPGGIYIGTAPEQNFSYIAAIQPRMAFIVDIRRENLFVHLIYKVLFENSTDRADFLSHLFSRLRPEGLDSSSSAQALFDAYEGAPQRSALATANRDLIEDGLIKKHGFKFSVDELELIDGIISRFVLYGPAITWSPGTPPPGIHYPTLKELMTATYPAGESGAKNWSYLASEHGTSALSRRLRKRT